MNDKKNIFIVNFKSDLLLIIVTWIVFLKLNPKVIVILLPISIFHFIYMHRDYKMEITNLKIVCHRILKSKYIIDMHSINEIRIGEARSKWSIFGPQKSMLIFTNDGEFNFDIYKFDVIEIVKVLKCISTNYDYKILDLEKDKLEECL